MRTRRTLLVVLTTALAAVLAVLTPGAATAVPPDVEVHANSPIEINNEDFRREVFWLDTSGRLWHKWEFTAGSGNFSQPQPLGGSGRLTYGQISAERNDDGRLEVFGVGTNYQGYHIYQRTAGGDWGPFYSMGGGFDGPLTVGKNADGRLEVFGIGQNKAMYHAYQRSAGGAWTGWYSLGGAPYASAPFHTSYSPGVGHYDDGALFVRAWDVDGYKWEKYQLVAGGDWLSGWTGASA